MMEYLGLGYVDIIIWSVIILIGLCAWLVFDRPYGIIILIEGVLKSKIGIVFLVIFIAAWIFGGDYANEKIAEELSDIFTIENLLDFQ